MSHSLANSPKASDSVILSSSSSSSPKSTMGVKAYLSRQEFMRRQRSDTCIVANINPTYVRRISLTCRLNVEGLLLRLPVTQSDCTLCCTEGDTLSYAGADPGKNLTGLLESERHPRLQTFLDFHFLKLYFPRFWVIWKIWPISVKRCKPVWIHACYAAYDTYLWLFAVGRHSTIITSRTMENKKCQKASSSHNSDQSCGNIKRHYSADHISCIIWLLTELLNTQSCHYW